MDISNSRPSIVTYGDPVSNKVTPMSTEPDDLRPRLRTHMEEGKK